MVKGINLFFSHNTPQLLPICSDLIKDSFSLLRAISYFIWKNNLNYSLSRQKDKAVTIKGFHQQYCPWKTEGQASGHTPFLPIHFTHHVWFISRPFFHEVFPDVPKLISPSLHFCRIYLPSFNASPVLDFKVPSVFPAYTSCLSEKL